MNDSMHIIGATEPHRRSPLALALTAALALGCSTPLWAATPPPVSIATKQAAMSADAKPAQKCLGDVRAFQSQMQKDGHWLHGSELGYGYPMEGYGYDELASPAVMGSASSARSNAYWRARPGYEIRTLIASATILAQRGQQQTCETLLGATRDIYGRHADELRRGDGPRMDGAAWRRERIAQAQPVAGSHASYRSDQLIGTEVMNANGDGLGSVDDLVLSPKTGKIAYLVIERGGVFGIDEKYVPVPWTIFRATPDARLLVLDSTKAVMKAAPEVDKDRFSGHDDFSSRSKTIDEYWSAHGPK